MTITHLHVAIIEEFDECLVDSMEQGLRKQVSDSLTAKSLRIPTDEEWKVCVEAEIDEQITIDCSSLPVILYYKILSKLGQPIATAT